MKWLVNVLVAFKAFRLALSKTERGKLPVERPTPPPAPEPPRRLYIPEDKISILYGLLAPARNKDAGPTMAKYELWHTIRSWFPEEDFQDMRWELNNTSILYPYIFCVGPREPKPETR